MRAADQLWRLGTGDQNRTDDQVRLHGQFNRVASRSIAVLELPTEHIVQITQARQRPIKHGHVGTHASRDLGCVCTNNAAADDQYLGRTNTRNTAHQNAASTVRLLQRPRTNLWGKTTRDFGHWGQQRQATTVIGHGFISDTGRTRRHQIACLFGIGSKVQVGK